MNASSDELRHAYQRLARIHHPDKTVDAVGNEDAFVRIQRAYDLLRDPEARRQYDATERAAHFASASAAAREFEVDLSEMAYEEEEGPEGPHAPACGVWRYNCRCGDEFVLRENQLIEGIDALHCRSCSLVLRPLYEAASEDQQRTAPACTA